MESKSRNVERIIVPVENNKTFIPLLGIMEIQYETIQEPHAVENRFCVSPLLSSRDLFLNNVFFWTVIIPRIFFDYCTVILCCYLYTVSMLTCLLRCGSQLHLSVSCFRSLSFCCHCYLNVTVNTLLPYQ